jgi:hypothetical protein
MWRATFDALIGPVRICAGGAQQWASRDPPGGRDHGRRDGTPGQGRWVNKLYLELLHLGSAIAPIFISYYIVTP